MYACNLNDSLGCTPISPGQKNKSSSVIIDGTTKSTLNIIRNITVCTGDSKSPVRVQGKNCVCLGLATLGAKVTGYSGFGGERSGHYVVPHDDDDD